MQENIIQKLEAEMLAHIGACCLESPKSVFVAYENTLLDKQLTKHGLAIVRANDGANFESCELLISAHAPNANLRDDSVLLVQIPSLISAFEDAKAALQGLERFKILMPFVIWNHDYWFAFASNTIHPLASFCLQRAEMLNGLDWYSAYMHQNAFVLPPNLSRALRGIVRN